MAKSKKTAYLVDFSFTCRVVVPNKADWAEIKAAAARKLRDEIADTSINNNVDEVFEDTENPYNPEFDA